MNIKKHVCFLILALSTSLITPLAVRAQQIFIRIDRDTATFSKETKLNGHMLTGKIITLKYQTMPGNQPAKNKNWVAVWQGTQVLYHTKPLRKVYITGNDADGDFAFDSLQLHKQDYTLAYGFNDSTSVAASLYFRANISPKEKAIPFFTNLELIEAGSNYLITGFDTPRGNVPANYKNWIGIWAGKSFSQAGENLIIRVEVKSTTSSDIIAINQVNLKKNSWYTLTYATGPAFSDIAASYSFLNN